MKAKLAVFVAVLPFQAFAHDVHEHQTTFGISEDSAAHLHLLINHFPIIGILMGLIALSLAVIWKSDGGRRIGLVLLALCNLAAYPTFKLGQIAYRHIRAIADDVGQDWLDTHMERAESLDYLFYFAALVAIIALYSGWRKLRWATALAVTAGIVSVAALVGAGWIADAGGKFMHGEIRDEKSVPAKKTQPAHEHHE